MAKRNHRIRSVVGVLAAALLIAGCAPGAGTNPAAPSQNPDRKVETDPASMGDITLTVWDQEVRGGQDQQMKKLNAAFQQKYPNIVLKRNSQSFDDLAKTLRLALTGDDAPDVVQSNNGRDTMGAFVKAKQLISLNPYATAYGWQDRYPKSVLQYSTYSADGKIFGEGNVYGLPQVGEVVVVFYSKKKLAKLGIEKPATWADFEAALKKAKGAGELPIQLGNIDKWPALHVFGPIQGTTTPVDQIIKLGLGNAGASWVTPENKKAASTMADWSKSGYFGNGPNGKDYDAAWSDFTKGKGVFLIGGSWLAADLQKAMKDDVAFMAPPPVTAGDPPITTGGTGLPFTVTSASKHPDAAAAYINFITNDAAMQTLADTGNMPVLNTAKYAPKSGVNKDVFEAFDAVTAKGSLLPYLDYATPTMSDTIGAALQNLIAGKSGPDKFTQTLQDDYAAFVKKNQ